MEGNDTRSAVVRKKPTRKKHKAVSSNSAIARTRTTSMQLTQQEPVDTTNERPMQGWERRLRQESQKRKVSSRKYTRECRRRQQEKLSQMLEECDALEEENRKLRIQLQVGKEADALRQTAQQEVLERMESMLKSGATDMDVHPVIEDFNDRFCDWGTDRISSFEFHIRMLSQLLAPQLDTRVLLQLLLSTTEGGGGEPGRQAATASSCSGTSASIRPDSAADEVFRCLVEHLELTPSQLHELRQLQQPNDGYMNKDAENVQQVMHRTWNTMAQLQRSARAASDGYLGIWHVSRETVPARISAAFFLWIAHNAACMHMLNELWGKIYKQCTSVASGDAEQVALPPLQNAFCLDQSSNIDDDEDDDDDGNDEEEIDD